MSEVFDKWDSEINTEELAKQVASAKTGDRVEIPHGVYEVKITYMALTETKTNPRPMGVITFEIVAGEYTGNRIYMNSVFDPKSQWCSFNIHKFNEFLRSMKTSIPVEFKTFGEYSQTILDIKGECDDRLLSFQLNYAADKKGKVDKDGKPYSTYTIEDVFENVPM